MILRLTVFLLGFGLATAASGVGADNSSLANDPEYRRAEALVAAGRWAEALPVLILLERDVQNQPDIHNLLGIVHRKLGDYPTSKRHYDRALELDLDHAPTLEYQGEWFLETGDLAAARANLARLRRLCAACQELRDLEAAFGRHGASTP
jgi:Flp pilus assembly protein TadD